MTRASRLTTGLAAAGLALSAGCDRPGGPSSATSWDWRPDAGGALADGGTMGVQTGPLTCEAAQTSSPLPARGEIMTGATSGGATTSFYTEDLFNLFKSNCGGCHVDTNLGNFHVTASTFATVVDQTVMAVIKTDDAAKYMPPAGAGGQPFSGRSTTDPIVVMYGLLQQWMAQGRPTELFQVMNDSTQAPFEGFMLTPQIGDALTNLGNCVPSRPWWGPAPRRWTRWTRSSRRRPPCPTGWTRPT